MAQILPHEVIELANRNIPRAAPFFLMRVDGMPFAMTEVVRVCASRDPNTCSSTQTTTHERFQQIGMGSIVAGSEAGILPEFGLHLLKALLAHNHGNLAHLNPVGCRCRNGTFTMPGRLQRGATLPGHGNVFAIGIQRAGVGRIGQQLPQRRRMPGFPTSRSLDA